jgi:uncharacterized protein YcbK (DUF882 family)
MWDGPLLSIELRSPAVLPMHIAMFVRRLASARPICALTVLVVLAALGPVASARGTQQHKHPRLNAMRSMLSNVVLPEVGFIPDDEDPPVDGPKYELRLVRQGGEIIDVIYRVGDMYVPEALDQLSAFLRDVHNDEVKSYDPRTFDVLHTMLAKLNRPSSEIEVLSGYRTKETNDALRESGTTNAAEHSQHIEANALDLRVPGVPAVAVRDAALSLRAGGVGYYPKGQFVHVDTGPARKWTYARHRGKHTRRRRHT